MFYGKAALGNSGMPAALSSPQAQANLIPVAPVVAPLTMLQSGRRVGAGGAKMIPTSPHRNAANRGAGGGSSVPSWELSLTSSSQQTRTAVEGEEAEQRNQLFAMFLFEAKEVRMDAREARRLQVEIALTLRQIDRDMVNLLKDTEPASRASIRIVEEKCCTALVHVLSLERAVIRCQEELHRAVQMEHRRRLFLMSFEEREYRAIMKSGESAALWRPGMHCFGPCPFLSADQDCPFRDEDLYGLHMDRSHFTSKQLQYSPARPTTTAMMIASPKRAATSTTTTLPLVSSLKSPKIQIADDDDVIGSIVRDGNPRCSTSSRKSSTATAVPAALAVENPSSSHASLLASLVRAR